MSFFTNLIYCCPNTRPVLFEEKIAVFVEGFAKLDVAEQNGCLSLELSSSAEDGPLIGQEMTEENEIGVGQQSSNWEFSAQAGLLEGIIKGLREFKRPIKRAFICLGNATSDLADSFYRPSSEENEVEFSPDSWSFELGPVGACSLSSNSPILVGWMGVCFSGYGYLYPWTLSDLRIRLESNSKVAGLMELCRTCWPAQRTLVSSDLKRMREKMGESWPYKELDRPLDWFWTMAETG